MVDDGGGDFESAPLPARANIRLLRHERNRGKGAAVRTGMLAARGRVRDLTDADLPYDRELIPLMTELIDARGFHLVIGDRTLPGSVYGEATSLARRMLSGFASKFVGTLVTGGFFDTQCGIKAVRVHVPTAFPAVRIDRFAFEVEVVYLALKHGLDIKRVPVRLRRQPWVPRCGPFGTRRSAAGPGRAQAAPDQGHSPSSRSLRSWRKSLRRSGERYGASG